MTIVATKTVRDLVTEIPASTRVFEELGIDYCCGGGRSLEEACSNAGVEVDKVLQSLKETAQAAALSDSPEKDWNAASLGELVSHIVDAHHSYVKAELPRLTKLIAKVCSVHGQNHPELLRIQKAFFAMDEELTAHLYKEEMILFPYISRMEAADTNGMTLSVPPFGSVGNPIRMMVMEHDNAGGLLREIREASHDFSVPADACISYKTLYEALGEFERDLHQHIHLENNILFPRAVRLEEQIMGRLPSRHATAPL